MFLVHRVKRTRAPPTWRPMANSVRFRAYLAPVFAVEHAVVWVHVRDVVAGTAVDPVRAGPTADPIIALVAPELVIAGAAVDRVVSGRVGGAVTPNAPVTPVTRDA